MEETTHGGSYQILFGDHIEKNEMGGVGSTYGGEERCIQGFGGEM